MDIIERMGQLHSGSARLLVYNLGKLHLADDIEFTDTSFADEWSDAHPDQARISRNIDIG